MTVITAESWSQSDLEALEICYSFCTEASSAGSYFVHSLPTSAFRRAEGGSFTSNVRTYCVPRTIDPFGGAVSSNCWSVCRKAKPAMEVFTFCVC